MLEVKGSAIIPLESLQKVNAAIDFCGNVKELEIKTNDQYVSATSFFRELSAHIATIESERKRVKEPYLQKGKDIDNWFKDPQAALANLKSKLDLAIRMYQRMLEDKRREEQERLNREAAERQRKIDEAARAEREKAERLRQEAEQASEAERKKLLEQAAKADARADIKQLKADMVIAPVAQIVVPEPKGISSRSNWKCEITDPVAFVKWAIEGGHNYLLMPNQTTCNAHAKTIRQEITVPGARFFNDEKLSSSRAA